MGRTQDNGARQVHAGIDDIIPILIDRRLIPYDAVLAGEVMVEAVPRRQRNFRVQVNGSSGVFVKQPEALASNGYATFQAEADFYTEYASCEGANELGVPHLLLYDRSIPLLAIEFLPHHRTLSDHCRCFTHGQFPIGTLRELGERIAVLHTVLGGCGRARRPGLGGQEEALPWVLSAHEPRPDALASLGPAGLVVLGIVQASPGIREGLTELTHLWRSDAVTHGDLRADNVLVRGATGHLTDLRIIDWELVGAGDACWDVACAIHGMIVLWLQSTPLDCADATAGPPATLSSAERLPWPVLQASVRALWQGYVDRMGHDGTWTKHAVPKVTSLVAARLLQTTLEVSGEEAEMSAYAVLLLQLCANMLAEPDRAAAHLLAIA
ncbi:phosphotransferase [Streptomyces roseus]|uniref:phosphotransferase n=1 Tax=Streptomyces roseus TaxID=66430 RepID=UPI00367C41A0